MVNETHTEQQPTQRELLGAARDDLQRVRERLRAAARQTEGLRADRHVFQALALLEAAGEMIEMATRPDDPARCSPSGAPRVLPP